VRASGHRVIPHAAGNLADDPRIEQAMSAAGFSQDMAGGQPGAWLSPSGVPVDLMVPEALGLSPLEWCSSGS
jgi:hypothetical protein